MATQTEIEQIIHQARERIPERTKALLEAQCRRGPLTNVQIVQLNNQVNHLQLDAFVCYVSYGIITPDVLHMLTRISPERLELATAIIQSQSRNEPEPPQQEDTHSQQEPRPQPGNVHSARESVRHASDVYILGLPSSGVTSVVTGLLGSKGLMTRAIRSGSSYVKTLTESLSAGKHTGQSPRDVTATIEADLSNDGCYYDVNIIELPCEDMATNIATQLDTYTPSLHDLGQGADMLLANANPKQLFLVVDLTEPVAHFNSIVSDTSPDGGILTYRIPRAASQNAFLHQMISLLSQPSCIDIMQRVEALNIIISKADLLGSGKQREEHAYQIFVEQHQDIIDPLIDLCSHYDVNRRASGQPMLYTYSLGRHDAHGHFAYDPADTNKLLEVLKGNVPFTRQGQ